MERLGVPTVTIVSDAFDILARAEARSLGHPDLPILVVPHPVAARPHDVLLAWGEALIESAVMALTEGGRP